MDCEAFEQLVSAWLDQPQRDDLRLQIEAAVAESRELARVRDEWLRLDRLVRSCLPGVDGIDWRRLQEHIAAALAPDAADTALDEQLRRFTDVGQRVDWPRLRQRISQAIGSSAEKPTVIRFPLRRAAASIVLAAAAAALLLVFILPAEPRTAPVSFAQARVVGGPQVSDAGRAFARVSVSAPPEATEEIKGEQPRERSYVEPRLAEVFLMVTPARPSGDNHGRINPFGFN